MTNTPNSICGTLLALLASALFDAEVSIDFSALDINLLFREAKAQAVAAIVFDRLPDAVAEKDPETYAAWQKYALKAVQQNIMQLAANAEVERLFQNAALPACTIKGFACAYYYPEPSLRQMGDIDFIVPKHLLRESEELMSRSGYTRIDEDGDHDFHISFKKDGNLYEMHESITTILDENGYVERYLDHVTETAVKVDLDFESLTVPDSFTHGLIMLLHMQRHMLSGGGIGLRHLCDWAVFVNTFSDSDWRVLFEEKLKQVNLWDFAMACSQTAHLYLHMPAQQWFVDFSDALSALLLNDMIIAGNFGHKDIKRYQELAFISRDVRHQKGFSAFWNAYINKVYSWKPALKKRKALLPLGVIAYPWRVLFKIVFKAKKISIVENYKGGHQRNLLYAELFKNHRQNDKGV